MPSLVTVFSEQEAPPETRARAASVEQRRRDFTLVVSEESIGAPPHASPFSNYMGARRRRDMPVT